MADHVSLYQAVLSGDSKTAVAVTRQALADNSDPVELITKYMVPAMDEVGRRFECEEYFVPELLLSARAMKGAMELLKPLLAERGAERSGRVVIGTVRGDLHDIGKNIVASMLEGAGFEVVDLGADVPPEKFIEAIKANHAQIVALSALLTVTKPAMKVTIEALRAAGLRDQVKVMIGGAPITRQYAAEIGADGYSENANGAVSLARNLMKAASNAGQAAFTTV
jgi:5-methyltetrahydrofolate--homocysteine methyltransferase